MDDDVGEVRPAPRQRRVDQEEAGRLVEAGGGVGAPREGQPAQPGGEQQLQQQRRPEHRQRHARHREQADGCVAQPLPAGRGGHPGWDARQNGERGRGQGELEGGRKEPAEVLGYRALGGERHAQIAPNQLLKVRRVLRQHRCVEVQVLAHLLHLLGSGPRPGVQRGGIRGHQPGHNEGDGDHAQDHQQAGGHPAQQVSGSDQPGPAGGARRCRPGSSGGLTHAGPAVCQALASISFHRASMWARVVQIEPTATRT